MKIGFLNLYNDNNKSIVLNLLLYFIFGTLFISLRTITIGSGTSTSIIDLFFSSLPDIFAFYIFIFALLKNKNKLRYSFFTIYDKLIFLYIITNILLGTYIAHNLTISLYAIQMTYFPMLFYFIARIGFNTDEKSIDNCIKNIANWYFIVSIIGLIIYFLLPDLNKYMTLKVTGIEKIYYIKRIGSLFWSPVVFAIFTTFGAIYTYFKIIEKETISRYLIYTVFWCCIFLTVSRGANVIFYFGWIFITIFSKKYLCFLKTLLIMMLVFFGLWLYDHDMYKVLIFIGDSTIDTFALRKCTRVDLWIGAFNDFIAKPMGYGLGKAGHVAVRFFSIYSKDVATYSTDGWYLKLANETGIWGLLSYATISIIFIVNSIKHIKTNKHTFYTFIFIFFIIVAIQNIVSNTLDFYSFSCLYWLLIGLSQNILLNERR